jgi:hypothetical protein
VDYITNTAGFEFATGTGAVFSQTLLFRFFFGEQGQQNLPLALVGHTRQQLAVAVDILIVDDRLFEIKFARIDP